MTDAPAIDVQDLPDGAADGEESSETPAKPPKSPAKNAIEWVIVIGGALLMAVLVRAFLFQAFYIPSESMNPTLVNNDRVVVNKLSYHLHAVHRHDVVVFSRPPGIDPNTKDLIKRVIGLPGETISLQDGHVLINGKQQSEPYIEPNSRSLPINMPGCVVDLSKPLTIPKGKVFVMGDNREHSLDSRCFGPIPESTIVGRAFVLVWPFSHLGTL